MDGGLLDAIAPGVELVFLCTPNNPTGRLVDGALLRAAAEQCRAVGAVLAVDECFLPLSDGAGPGLAPCLAEYPNLLLLRAFTKSYAMAGLRLGYALSANGGLLERMAAAGPPWSVSTPAQAAGLAALEQCSDWPEKPGPCWRRSAPPCRTAWPPWGWRWCPDRPTTCCSGRRARPI